MKKIKQKIKSISHKIKLYARYINIYHTKTGQKLSLIFFLLMILGASISMYLKVV